MRLEGCAVRRVVRICTYADMRLEVIRLLRADCIFGFLAVRYFSVVVSSIGYFLYGFVDVFSHRV